MKHSIIEDKRGIFLLCAVFIFSFLSLKSQSHKSEIISIVGTGDVILGINYPEDAPLLPAHDGAMLFTGVKHFISNATLSFCNLEGVLLDTGGTPKSCKDTMLCYRFRMPEKYAKLLSKAGYDIISIANNHSNDFGITGRHRTYSILRQEGLYFAGAKDSCAYTLFTHDGIKYGFCAFAPNKSMVDLRNIEKAVHLIHYLDSVSDIVIVSMHGGAEGRQYTRVTREDEFYIGENRGNVYAFAHACIDAGADIIFGHGPHVVRGIELYQNRFIAYSLGNFCTPFGVSKKGINGYAPLIKVNIDKEGNFLSGEIFSAIQFGHNGPRPDKEKLVIKEIQTLTLLDFPDTPLKILPNGKIINENNKTKNNTIIR